MAMAGHLVALTCPTCASTEIEPNRFGSYRCRHCRGLFLVRAPTPERPRSLVPVRADPWVRGGAVALGVLLLGVIVIAAAPRRPPRRIYRPPAFTATPPRLATTPPRLATTSPRLTVTPSLPQDEAKEPPRAELRGVRQGRGTTGSHFWLARYVNTGTTPIARPAARVSLFDAQGHRVGEQKGYAHLHWLNPGEETPILVLVISPPGYARAEAAVVTPEPPRYDRPPLRLLVTESSVQRASLGPAMVGTVRNQTGQVARFIHVQVVGLDAQGELALLSHAYATEHTLAAGRETGFQVPIGSFQVGAAVKYQLEAFASAR